MALFIPSKFIGVWRSAGGVAHTGDTAETALATISLPPLKAGDFIRVYSLWSNNNSGGTKRARVRLNGLSGTVFMGIGVTTTTLIRDERVIGITSATSQICWNSGQSGWGSASAAAATGSVDVSTGTTLLLTGICESSSSDTITLEDYVVEIGRP